MSSLVYFKFKANVKTDSVQFDGSSISVKDLKTAIRMKCGLHSMDFDLKLEDTTGKAYTKDDELIPKYTSIVVRRVPKISVENQKKRLTGPDEISWRELQKNAVGGETQQSTKHVNLADSDLPEEEKIKIMMERSSEVYSEKNFAVKAKPYGVPPAAYVCHKCNQPGHWIHNCPGVRDKTGKMMDVKSVKRPTGIPLDFLLEVEAGTPGAYLGKSGRYMVPIKDAEAYAQGKKDKRPFSVEENPPYVPQERKPPKRYICPLCDKLFKDAVLVSCCGTTYCNDCIMGHVFDSQVLGSHKCPNCNAILTDHESSVFENAVVRSMIRDWLANESELTQSETLTIQDDIPKFSDTEKMFVNNRRVLKPRQATVNQTVPTNPEQTTGVASHPQQETKSEVPDSEPVPIVKNELSDSSISKIDIPDSNDNVTISSPSVLPLEPISVSEVTSTTNSFPVKTINTSASVVASAPCTTLVEANRQSLLATTGGLPNAQLPCISYASSAMMPAVLPSINGGGNPLLNALYNMRVDSLPASLVAPTTILSTPFQGPLVGGPDWTAGTALTASAAQSTGIVDPVLQVNSNQVATFGLVPGQVIPSALQTSIPASIPETLDGHRMLSREEFYRLKMEALQLNRRRRHRSRSRSSGYSPHRSSRPYSKSSRHDYHEREKWERRAHHSSKDYGMDYSRHRHRQLEENYDPRRDRIPIIRSRHRPTYIEGHEDDLDRYRSREHVYNREHRSKLSSELSPTKNNWMRCNYQPSPPHISQEPRKAIRNREPHLNEGAFDIVGINRSRSRTPVSVVPQYESSDTESGGRRKHRKRESCSMESKISPKKAGSLDPRIPYLNPSPSPEPGIYSRNPCSLRRPMSSDNLMSDSRIVINLAMNERNENDPIQNLSDAMLPIKKKKKDKKNKKHKHKHAIKREADELPQDFDQDNHIWIPNEISVDGELNDLIRNKHAKKHKKHKKHKHGKEKKKRIEQENIEQTDNFVFIHETNDSNQI